MNSPRQARWARQVIRRKVRVAWWLSKVGAVVPYETGARLLAAIFGQPWVQRTIFRRQLKLIREMLPWVVEAGNEREVVQLALFSWFIRIWQLRALSRCSDEQLDKWVSISGLEHLEELYDSGRKVILVNSHFLAARCVPLVLGRLGYEIYSFESSNATRRWRIRYPDTVRVIPSEGPFYLKELYQMHTILKEGKVLHLAADGFRGASGITLPFMGRLRRFRAGFAELAVGMGAIVIPAFAFMSVSGEVRIELLEPLDPGNPKMSADAKIERLIRQYVSLAQRKCYEAPGNITPGRLRRMREQSRPAKEYANSAER